MAICFADMRPCFTAYALWMNFTAKTGVVSVGGMAFFILEYVRGYFDRAWIWLELRLTMRRLLCQLFLILFGRGGRGVKGQVDSASTWLEGMNSSIEREY